MRYYHIKITSAFWGEFRIVQQGEDWGSPLPVGSTVLWYESSDPSNLGLQRSSGGDFFVTSALKKAFDSYSFPEISFTKVDKLLWPEHNNESFKHLDENSFWKINFPTEEPVRDFLYYQNRYLVVSETALDFLRKNGGFLEAIAGYFIGKEYEVLANRFWIPGDIKTYFEDIYPKESEFVETMCRRILNEMRRREGRPPLPLHEGVD
jgi:hypothetical protein